MTCVTAVAYLADVALLYFPPIYRFANGTIAMLANRYNSLITIEIPFSSSCYNYVDMFMCVCVCCVCVYTRPNKCMVYFVAVEITYGRMVDSTLKNYIKFRNFVFSDDCCCYYFTNYDVSIERGYLMSIFFLQRELRFLLLIELKT